MNKHLFLSSATALALALVLLSCSSSELSINTTTEAATEAATEAVTAAAVQEAVPTVTEPVPEPAVETTSAATTETAPSETLPEVTIAPDTGETHIVDLIDGGFEVPEITIKAGDTIVWQNVREKNPVKALIVAGAPCAQIKSGLFLPGSSFKWKFEKHLTCRIIDGIFTTEAMKVKVE